VKLQAFLGEDPIMGCVTAYVTAREMRGRDLTRRDRLMLLSSTHALAARVLAGFAEHVDAERWTLDVARTTAPTLVIDLCGTEQYALARELLCAACHFNGVEVLGPQQARTFNPTHLLPRYNTMPRPAEVRRMLDSGSLGIADLPRRSTMPSAAEPLIGEALHLLGDPASFADDPLDEGKPVVPAGATVVFDRGRDDGQVEAIVLGSLPNATVGASKAPWVVRVILGSTPIKHCTPDGVHIHCRSAGWVPYTGARTPIVSAVVLRMERAFGAGEHQLRDRSEPPCEVCGVERTCPRCR
jgi:hypothetical protein